MPSRPAATAARIRLCAIGAASVWRVPFASSRCTVIVVTAARRVSEAAEVFARLPGVGVGGGAVALELEALDADKPVDDLRRERAHELGVGSERIERRA